MPDYLAGAMHSLPNLHNQKYADEMFPVGVRRKVLFSSVLTVRRAAIGVAANKALRIARLLLGA